MLYGKKEKSGDCLMRRLLILILLTSLVILNYCETGPPDEMSQQLIMTSADKSLSLLENIDEEGVIRDDRLFKLKHEETIPLLLNENTPILGEIGGINSIAIRDSSIFLLDREQVYQFNLTGTYIQPIGGPGKGPGEYITPMTLSVAPSGHILIYDGSTLRVNLYDEHGGYVDMNLINNLCRVLFDSAGNRLQLSYSWISEDKTVVLARQDKTTQRWSYVIDLSSAYTFEAFVPFTGNIGLCYSSALESIFYLEPWSYKIKEIDARSGEVKRQFGLEPPNYIGIKKDELMALSKSDRRLQTLTDEYTLLAEMHLIADTYLLLRFKLPFSKKGGLRQEVESFIAYDISAEEIRAFTVDIESVQAWIWIFIEKQSADTFTVRKKFPTRTVAKGSFLYTYKEPLTKDLDNSNGTIEIFSAFIE